MKTRNIFIGILLVLMIVLSNCDKEVLVEPEVVSTSQFPKPPPPTSQAFSQNYCGDTIYMGAFYVETAVKIGDYWQGRIVPIPTVLPYNTDRRACPDKFCGWMLVVDTVEIVEGQRFTLTRTD